ncbi:MAG TPA: hypothetical protein VIK01_21550 [Polyangiaceae bacterium]
MAPVERRSIVHLDRVPEADFELIVIGGRSLGHPIELKPAIAKP